jgi:hypothetical protein
LCAANTGLANAISRRKTASVFFIDPPVGIIDKGETQAEGLQEQNLPAQAAFRRAVARESCDNSDKQADQTTIIWPRIASFITFDQ